MREYQAVVRVAHEGLTLSEDDARETLDLVTGELLMYSPAARLWQDRSEFTMTVGVPSLWDVAPFAGRSIRDAFKAAGLDVAVVRVDAWLVEEWDEEQEATGTAPIYSE
ncbi:hypothetical protein Psi02_17160 [Planotetraspora silvatica]|uniref:Uncharacterized protein n=1 Tax=Planotetraspora silvatica TaxID=234614 RepID=A0A8J3XKH8_9ACTN|nr:hypothetical protein [Planotetraspora silvatica]GII45292.1 hypothetical protein Psi02_17160 [Planotetraspora silvatica]